MNTFIVAAFVYAVQALRTIVVIRALVKSCSASAGQFNFGTYSAFFPPVVHGDRSDVDLQ
jgi:hypothetical protein